jgi:DNA mismatch repair ATPase MutL
MTTSSQIKSKSKQSKSKQSKSKRTKSKQTKSKQSKSKQSKSKQTKSKQTKSKRTKSKQSKSKQSKSKRTKSKQSKSKWTLQKKKKGNTKIKGGANCNDGEKVGDNKFKFSYGGVLSRFHEYFICYNVTNNQLTLLSEDTGFFKKKEKSFDISECILVKTELPKTETETETETEYEIRFRTIPQANSYVKIIKTTNYEDYRKLYDIFNKSTTNP